MSDRALFYYHDDGYRGPAQPDRPLSWRTVNVAWKDGAYEVTIRTNDATDANRMPFMDSLDFDRVTLP